MNSTIAKTTQVHTLQNRVYAYNYRKALPSQSYYSWLYTAQFQGVIFMTMHAPNYTKFRLQHGLERYLIGYISLWNENLKELYNSQDHTVAFPAESCICLWPPKGAWLDTSASEMKIWKNSTVAKTIQVRTLQNRVYAYNYRKALPSQSYCSWLYTAQFQGVLFMTMHAPNYTKFRRQHELEGYLIGYISLWNENLKELYNNQDHTGAYPEESYICLWPPKGAARTKLLFITIHSPNYTKFRRQHELERYLIGYISP